ncbi:MAG TPA: ATP-binding protein, partial [Rubrivivax sp.]|nr:ATP-binding protein [Rubrivivax sp.]
ELLFRDYAQAFNTIPGRMSPYSAGAFIVQGLALILLPQRRLGVVVAMLAVLVFAIGSLSVLGYLWNASELVTDAVLPPVAIHTGVAFTLLGGGTLLASRRGIERHAPDGLSGPASVENKVAGGFIVALTLLVAGGGITYRNGAEFGRSVLAVSQTQEIRTQLVQLYAAVADAESAQRDYLLTGSMERQRAHLEYAGQAMLHAGALESLVADRPAEREMLAEIRAQARRRLDALGRVAVLYEQGGLAAAQTELVKEIGTRLMDELRRSIQALDDKESALLAQRQAQASADQRKSLVFLLLTLFGAGAVLVFLLQSIRREMLARAATEERVLRLNADLERGLVERTAALRDSQQAREAADLANRAKSVFLATMSHEIRTPMNGVLGMIELLALTRLDEEQRNTLGIVHESGESLMQIIDDILDFSKIEAGRLELRPEVASLAQVVSRTQNMYSGMASGKGLLLRVEIDPRIAPAMWFDPLRLGQILNNLLSNAIKFTASGSVTLSAQHVGRDAASEQIRLAVTDTGVGIDADNQARLFQPFTQAEPDTTRTYGGTGLGLAICNRLAEMMGARIEMRSALGSGTTMTLTLSLPLADLAELPPAAHGSRIRSLAAVLAHRRAQPSVQAAEADGTLVLVADDHPTNRGVLMHQLRALGYAAESAVNGVQAMALWRSRRFGLVVTDCNMPEMDGYALARHIRRLEAPTGARVPIIACTANALDGEQQMCLDAGMDDYLAKPIEITALMKVLDRWLPLPQAGGPVQPSAATRALAAPAAPAVATLDRTVLGSLIGHDDPELHTKIYRDYQRSTAADLDTLRRAAIGRDGLQLARAAHRVCGASRSVGAHALADMADALQQAGDRIDWPRVDSQLLALDSEWERLCSQLLTPPQTEPVAVHAR